MESTATAARPAALSSDATAYAGLTVATLCWASAFIGGKVVMAEMTPLVASAWRYAFAVAMLLPFALRGYKAVPWRRLWVHLALLTIGGGLIYPYCFLSSLQHTTATNSSLLIALNPVFTVLAAPFIGERLSAHRLLGVLLALSGAVVVITQGEASRLLDLSLNRGDLLALGAAATWALFNLLSRRVLGYLSPAFINTLIYSIGGIALAALGWSEAPLQQLLAATPAAWAGLLVMSVLASVLAGQLFLLGLRALGVGRAVVFIYFVPVLTAILSAVMLREAPTLAQLAGGTAVLIGVYISTREAAPARV